MAMPPIAQKTPEGFRTDHGILEDRREFAAQFPGREERRPVDEGNEFRQRKIVERARTEKLRRRNLDRRPIGRESPRQRVGIRHERSGLPIGKARPVANLIGADLVHERRLAVGVQQTFDDRHRDRGVVYMHDRLTVLRSDLHRRVLGRRRRAANQQRNNEALPLHLFGDMHHLVERRRDQAAQPNDVGTFRNRRFQNLLARDHHAEIDDLEVVAPQHDGDDVLADDVNIAFDRGDDDLAA